MRLSHPKGLKAVTLFPRNLLNKVNQPLQIHTYQFVQTCCYIRLFIHTFQSDGVEYFCSVFFLEDSRIYLNLQSILYEKQLFFCIKPWTTSENSHSAFICLKVKIVRCVSDLCVYIPKIFISELNFFIIMKHKFLTTNSFQFRPLNLGLKTRREANIVSGIQKPTVMKLYHNLFILRVLPVFYINEARTDFMKMI